MLSMLGNGKTDIAEIGVHFCPMIIILTVRKNRPFKCSFFCYSLNNNFVDPSVNFNNILHCFSIILLPILTWKMVSKF